MLEVEEDAGPKIRGTSPVSSHNGWDPLEEVIVGTARGAYRYGYEPSLAPFLPPTSRERSTTSKPYAPGEIDEAERQLDQFAELLSRQGIRVRRPEAVDHSYSVETPDFSCAFGHAQACPRDVLLVVGDEILEAPMAQRGRYFEFRAYRKILIDYFRQGARWEATPKPSMADSLYTPDYDTTETAFDFSSHPSLTETEPCFDAASFCRMGRDIFWQPDIVSNQLGADWLARHLGPDYRLHRVEFSHPHPHHIDTSLVPLRPGLAITCPDRPAKGDCLAIFEKNDWKLIEGPPPVRPRKLESAWDVSSWISLNILSLDENTVIVEETEEPLIELLKSLRFDVLTLPFRSVYQFGGSFHCCTVDVRRSGSLKSYFSYFPGLDT